MTIEYQTQTIESPTIVMTAGQPLAHRYAPSIPQFLFTPKFWATVSVSFTAFGLVGGLFLGTKITEARVVQAENATKTAQERQQQAEARLQGNLSQTNKFCNAVLASPPSGNPQPQPTAVASNP